MSEEGGVPIRTVRLAIALQTRGACRGPSPCLSTTLAILAGSGGQGAGAEAGKESKHRLGLHDRWGFGRKRSLGLEENDSGW